MQTEKKHLYRCRMCGILGTYTRRPRYYCSIHCKQRHRTEKIKEYHRSTTIDAYVKHLLKNMNRQEKIFSGVQLIDGKELKPCGVFTIHKNRKGETHPFMLNLREEPKKNMVYEIFYRTYILNKGRKNE